MATCVNCGEELAPGWKFCIHCGQAVGGSSDAKPGAGARGDAVPAAIRPDGTAPARRPVNWFAVAGIGALILGIGLIAISVTYLVGALK